MHLDTGLFLRRPEERRTQVVVCLFQTLEPLLLPLSTQFRFSLLRKPQIVFRVRLLRFSPLLRLKLFAGKVSEGLQHPKPHLGDSLFRLYQGTFPQLSQHIQRQGFPRYRFCRLHRPAATEDTEPGEEPL
jgi:hypothetical protein